MEKSEPQKGAKGPYKKSIRTFFTPVQLVHRGLFVFVIQRRLGSESSQPFNEVSALSHKREIQRSDKVGPGQSRLIPIC